MVDSDLYDYYYDIIDERVRDIDYNTPLIISRDFIGKYGYYSETEFNENIISPIICSLAVKYKEDDESLSEKLSGCIRIV